MKHIQYQSNLPYPPVRIAEPNQRHARIILSDLGGKTSEMSAVSLYFYDHLVTRQHPEIAQAFHSISIVEMRHLELLGQVAMALGADPRLWSMNSCNPVYWSPRHNQYTRNLRALFHNALQAELAAIEKYNRQCAEIGDPHIVEILRRIVIDEQLHVAYFREMLEKI